MSLTAGAVSGTFLSLLDDKQRAALLELGTRRAFPRGAALMYEGEPGERVMILEDGRVKVTRIEPGGHETLLSIRDPGDLIGEVSLIDERPRLATVTALEPVRALVIASSVFRGYLERTPRVAVALLEVETQRFRESTVKRSQFAASDTTGRLAARIVELSERYGADHEDGIEIDLALTQDDIAAWTGASRAGVAKAFQTLRELGWIETHRRRLVVRQLDALHRRAA
jgi:CRP/FNR family transcriptional regulator, cyclic AMP receptor protein